MIYRQNVHYVTLSKNCMWIPHFRSELIEKFVLKAIHNGQCCPITIKLTSYIYHLPTVCIVIHRQLNLISFPFKPLPFLQLIYHEESRHSDRVDRDSRDSLVVTSQSVYLHFNLLTHFIKVCILFTLLMEKLRPF